MIIIIIILTIVFFLFGFDEGCRFRKAKEENDKTEGDLGSDLFGNSV